VSRHFPRYRFVLQAGYDAVSWMLALLVASLLRFDLDLAAVPWSGVAEIAVLAAVAQVAVGRVLGMYVHRWRYGTFDEVVATVKTVATVTVLITAVDLMPGMGRPIPWSVAVLSGFLVLFVMAIARFAWRVQLERWAVGEADDGREPVVIYGAGEAGLHLITSMRRTGPYEPVAVLDDNADLHRLLVKGVPVRGDRTALADVVERTGATTMIVAIPSAGAELLRDLVACADAAGVSTLTVPPIGDLLGGQIGVADVRPLTEADLLGRREINLDIDSVADYLTGKRVLVTGAGGSIGSELCRQLHRFAPESLVMLDRDESALQAVQLSIEGRGLLDSRDLVVCCIRDRSRLAEVFAEHRPQVVFHAAALKHLPLLEMHPDEGWKTNVEGTQHLLELAGAHGVEKFVNISTDKAAEPTSVLGRTKRLAEQLTSHAGGRYAGTYLSVRFGNVLGSRGSVLPLFREQLAAGGPLTVTDPEVTRYFMTIPEACQLTVQAGALGGDGEVMVLDMGEPVRIADLARRLAAEADRHVEIVFTGLRPGEKLHEVLFAPDERSTVSEHPMIHRVDVPPLQPELVISAGLDGVDFGGGSVVINLRVDADGERGHAPADVRSA
jgi:FlaA1/EpsC-like NDP-sugar epimerase